MKVLLIALYDIHSKGIRGLHSFLDRHGHNVSSFFFKESTYEEWMFGPQEVQGLMSTIGELKPDFIGIGVRSPLFPVFTHISDNIRVHFPDIKIIAGGPHATADPQSCLEYADYAVPGDGEYAMLDILDGAVEGVIKRSRVLDLDSLPFAHYGDKSYSFGPTSAPVKVSAYTTRGCFFNCTYCQESILQQKPVRKSVKYFKEEIEYFKSLFPKMKLITLSDSNFLYDMDWLEEFAKEFSGMGLRFWCAGNAKLITEEMLQTVKSAGVDVVRIGVQSGSPWLRKRVYNRKDTLEEVFEVSQMLHRNSMTGHYDFIIENPYDTPQTISETRDFIRKLPSSALTNKFELRYWPGTALTEMALQDEYISEDDVEGNFMRFGGWTYVYQTIYREG